MAEEDRGEPRSAPVPVLGTGSETVPVPALEGDHKTQDIKTALAADATAKETAEAAAQAENTAKLAKEAIQPSPSNGQTTVSNSSDSLYQTLLGAVQKMSTEEKYGLISAATSEFTKNQKKEAVKRVNQGGLAAGPGYNTRNWIWGMVMGVFSIILLLTVGTLCAGVIFNLSGKISDQTILAVFTSVVGFLAGLFAPSPTQSANDSNTTNSQK